MKLIYGVALAALALASGPALPADASGQFAVRGAGFATCHHFLRAHELKAKEWYVFHGWLDGYLSAVNEKSTGTFDVAPWQSTELIAEVIRSTCQPDSKQHFFPLVRSVVLSFQKHALDSVEAKKAIEVGDNTALIYPSTVHQAQVALAGRGYFKGTPSGKFDAETQAAIEAFQAKHAIPVNGLPGPVTLWALLVEELN
jgi:hypothetical protein